MNQALYAHMNNKRKMKKKINKIKKEKKKRMWIITVQGLT
jgi:ligand-binding sensor domain-containing protein